jgi:hypothetical protein
MPFREILGERQNELLIIAAAFGPSRQEELD